MSVSVENLLQRDPDQLRVWLDREISSRNITITDVNWWLSLAQGAALRATPPVSVDRQSLRWAEISLIVYDFLANRLDTQSKNSYECSEMNLRSSLIVNNNSIVNNPILDPNIIEDWFVSRLDMTFDKVAEFSSNWKKLSISDVKRLRDLKNRMTPVKVLIEAGYISDNSELVRWLQVREKLP